MTGHAGSAPQVGQHRPDPPTVVLAAGGQPQRGEDGSDQRQGVTDRGDLVQAGQLYQDGINMLGRYSFQLPELPGGLRPLRDPDATDDE